MRASLSSLVFSLAVVVAVSASQTAAQVDSLDSASTSAAHLAEISASLGRIADLLQSQAEGRRLDLVMQRIDLRQRRLEPLEARLRMARATRDGYEEERFRLQSQLENMADEITSGGLEVEEDQVRMTTNYIESELTVTATRLRATNDEIATLENEVSRYRNEIEDWESWVDRELSDL